MNNRGCDLATTDYKGVIMIIMFKFSMLSLSSMPADYTLFIYIKPFHIHTHTLYFLDSCYPEVYTYTHALTHFHTLTDPYTLTCTASKTYRKEVAHPRGTGS